jgi:peptide deformylase
MKRLFSQAFVPVLQMGNPMLRQVCTPVAASEFGSKATLLQINRMWKVIEDEQKVSGNDAVGLAAPQIGWTKRVVALRGPPGAKSPLPDTLMINPTLSVVGEEKILMEESCLSVRGLVGAVSRHKRVTVEFVDASGRPRQLFAEGWYAGLVQHEMDHLTGTLFVDRANSRALAFVDEWNGDAFPTAKEEDGKWKLV